MDTLREWDPRVLAGYDPVDSDTARRITETATRLEQSLQRLKAIIESENAPNHNGSERAADADKTRGVNPNFNDTPPYCRGVRSAQSKYTP